MKELKYFEKIENYLSGKEDKTQFENELKQNSLLKEEYDATIAANKALEILAFEQLDEELNLVKNKQQANLKYLARRITSIAAVFLLVVLSFLWYANANYSNGSLAKSNFIKPNFDITRGTDYNVVQSGATAYYNNGYSESIKILNSVHEVNPRYIDAQYVLGFSYLKNTEYSNSINAFKNVLISNREELKPSARWHLILALIKNDEPGIAQTQLKTIIDNPDDNYHSKAVELSYKLNSKWRKIVF